LPELAEHMATESGWIVATGTLSGVGGSTGTFSATQWRADLKTILDRVDEGERKISMAGFGFGGALALATAAEDERIRGVATFATPAHLEPWCGSAEDFRRAVQIAGVVGNERDLLPARSCATTSSRSSPLVSIAKIPPRRLMVGHGTEDIEIPHSDARDLVAAAEGRAELRLIQGAVINCAPTREWCDVVRLARPAPLTAPRPGRRGSVARRLRALWLR